MTSNIGEAIAILGIMLAVGLTKNYWLLFFTIMPILTWLRTNTNSVKEAFNMGMKINQAKLDKLREEIRLLKNRKR
jgi:hypothetical protein